MKARLRMAVIGTGMMALRRTRAFLETGNVELVGVASRSASRARQFAGEWGCSFSTSNFRSLENCRPDFLLIEVPHKAQHGIVKWALEQRFHLLIGSCMATNERQLAQISELAHRNGLIAEAGFEARYKGVWLAAKQLIDSGAIGEVAAIQAIACWNADTDSWYYSQKESGGMPVTHMTYAFLNPLTWIFGMPLSVSALANAKGVQVPGMVDEVTCSANIAFGGGVVCQLLASYIHHSQAPNWRVFVHGTTGALEIHPGEFDPGQIIQYATGQAPVTLTFEDAPDPFRTQAELFIEALKGTNNHLQNSPKDGLEDVRTAAAIVESAERGKTVRLTH